MLTCFICVSKFLQIKKNSNKKQYKVYIFCVLCIEKKTQIIAKITGCTVALACTTGLYQLKCYSLGFNSGHYLGYYKLGTFGTLAMF